MAASGADLRGGEGRRGGEGGPASFPMPPDQCSPHSLAGSQAVGTGHPHWHAAPKGAEMQHRAENRVKQL